MSGLPNPDKKRSAQTMADQPTPRTTLAAHHKVTTWCPHCGHVSELDLPELIAAGHGDTPLLELPLRCARCGERRFQLTVAWAGRKAP